MGIRVVQLELDGAPVELHPRLTVVDASNEARRQRLVDAMASVASGRDPAVAGVLDAQGLVFDLDQSALDLLDLGAPVDSVVRAGDLGARSGAASGGAPAAGDIPESAAVAAPAPALSPDVVAAREAHANAVRATSVAAGALAAARVGRDPFASTALDIARARLAAVEGAGDDIAGLAGPSDDDEHTIEALRARTSELESALLALDAVDPFPVRIALDQLGAAPARRLISDGGLPGPEAEAAMAEIAAIDRELAGDAHVGGPSPLVEVAHQRLQAARDGLFEAERAARMPVVDPEIASALESAHAEVMRAAERSDGRRSRRRAQRRLERARAAERELLERLGFQSYRDFTMGTSLTNIPPEAFARLERARRELSDSEDMVAALDADAEAAITHAALSARRASLLQLTSTRTAGDEPASKLQAALESAGFVFENMDVSEAVLVELAEVWLEEQRDVAAHRQRVEEELVEIERRLAASGSVVSAGDRESAIADARAAVAAAEVRVARHRDAEEEVARRQAAYYGRVADEASAAAKVASLEAQTGTPSLIRHDNGPPEGVDWHLLIRVAGVRSASYVGSVPLVVDRALDGLPGDVITTSLDRLERLASTVQTVVITGDEAVFRWVSVLSPERAAVIR